jgi:DNA topoisomerase II
MAQKSIEQQYRKLTDVQHVRLRPGMYIGSVKPNTSNVYVLQDDKISLKPEELSYIPGFMKIFDEILSNSVDEHKRPGSKLDTVKVTVENGKISIWDNGGISVVKHKEYGEWIPEMIFSNMRSGSNFNDDEQRTVAGTNGVGSVLTNIFSKEFNVVTSDGKKKFTQTFKNGMTDKSKAKVIDCPKKMTEISFTPDYEYFGLNGLDKSHFRMIQKRVVDVAGCNPSLKVYFNGELIRIKTFEDYVKFYSSEYIYESQKLWEVAIAPTDYGYKQVSFVNSVETYEGGTHVDHVLNQIVNYIREYVNKKHKVDVRPSEIKNHLFIFVNCTVINPIFNTQSKEKLITEQKDFGSAIQLTDKFLSRIVKSEVVASLIDWLQKKQQAEENKELRKLNKELDKFNVQKLIDAKGRQRDKCILGIYEGLSALSAFRNFRDTQTMGAFPLRGKFLNVLEQTNLKVSQNVEALNLMAAIGLKFGEQPHNLRYGKIYIYTDADYDGDSISALLINFFYKYWPELFQQRRIYKVMTPLVVAKRGTSSKFFYTSQEYDTWIKNVDIKNWNIEYKKGLASLEDSEYKEILLNPHLVRLDWDNEAKKFLEIWFGTDTAEKKKLLLPC